MTLTLTLLSLPLAAGAVKYGVRNAYFWIIRYCLDTYMVLPAWQCLHSTTYIAWAARRSCSEVS